MPELLVRHLSPEILTRLKAQAKDHGRSLQGEIKQILETAVTFTPEEAAHIATDWQQRLAGQALSDSAELIRADRDR